MANPVALRYSSGNNLALCGPGGKVGGLAIIMGARLVLVVLLSGARFSRRQLPGFESRSELRNPVLFGIVDLPDAPCAGCPAMVLAHFGLDPHVCGSTFLQIN